MRFHVLQLAKLKAAMTEEQKEALSERNAQRDEYHRTFNTLAEINRRHNGDFRTQEERARENQNFKNPTLR